jgi:hypothetical protein
MSYSAALPVNAQKQMLRLRLGHRKGLTQGFPRPWSFTPFRFVCFITHRLVFKIFNGFDVGLFAVAVYFAADVNYIVANGHNAVMLAARRSLYREGVSG